MVAVFLAGEPVMTKLIALSIATAFAAVALAPGIAGACMKSSVSAQSTPVTTADGAGTTTTLPPVTPTPETKTGG
jgi:hypothetical protein